MSLSVTKREKCVKTSISIPLDVRRKASAFSHSRKRSLSWYVTQLLEKDLTERELERSRS